MRKTLILMAAGLMTLTALPAAAAPAQERSYQQDRGNDRNDHRGNDHRGNDNRNDHRGNDNDRYGRWDSNWGARPGSPPRNWSRPNDWYRHVRACSQRYRSYNPRTDTYVVRRGRTAVCRL